MSWYRAGSINLTNGSVDVTGVDTAFKSEVRFSDILLVGGSLYEISRVVSDTSLKLTTPYEGGTVAGSAYAVIRNLTNASNFDLMKKIEEFLTDRQRSFDEFTDWINGLANSGPTSDGVFPLTDRYGVTVYCKSPKQLEHEIANVAQQQQADSAELEAVLTDAEGRLAAIGNQQAWADQILGYKNSAAASEAKAKDWADKAEDSTVETGKYSAKHHANKAAASASAAASSASAAATSKTGADTAKTAAESAKTAAEAAKTAAESAKTAAQTSESNAASSASAAATSKTGADTAKNAAESAKIAAQTSESNAATSASNASASASAAATSKTAADNAKTAAQAAESKASKWADESEDVAVETGKYSAKHHANKSAASASSAAASASSASTSASNAATSKTGADTAKAAAEAAKTAAQAAQTAAESARTAAQAAQAAAETAETNAQASEDTAAAHKNSASASEVNAAASETNALSYKNAAATSATNAAGSEVKAGKWAEEAENVQVETGKYSAKHHANKAAASAAAAAASESAAASSASAAASSASAASASADAAESSNVSASNSASAASSSASQAAASESAASASATSASTSATNASNSASAAATSEANAASSSSSASASASNASASEAAALAYRDQAKTYRDEAQTYAASLAGGLAELGSVDLSGGAYPIKPVDAGGFWKVVVGGTVDGIDYGVGDTLVYSNALDEFYKIDNTESVTSVAGKQGIVTLDKSDVGLSNVDNTSDLDKPVSTATQTALNAKLNSASYTAEDVLNKVKTVDGSGSGLDADLLDGQEAAFFLNASNINAGTLAVARGGTGATTTTGTGSNVLSVSPALTGAPTAPTAAVNTNTTQLANTAFVLTQIANDAPTKSGTGATGTWGISVSGNAATATKLQTARTINGVPFDGTANITIEAGTPDAVAKAGDVMTGALTSHYASQTRLIRAPAGAAYTGASTSTGTIKITLPNSWTNTMLRMRVGLYDYNTTTGESVLELSGYNSVASGWTRTSARIMGRHRLGAGADVRFAHDGTNCCILIGTTALSLSYLKVVVEDVYLSYAGVDDTWNSGWSITQITSETGITVTSTQPLSNNNPAEMLNWQKYSNHFVFDASNGKMPDGTACSDTNPAVDWAAGYPTLMGWNGAGTTYGVRVARAQKAEQLATARTINGVSFDGTGNITVYDSTKVARNHTVNSTNYAAGGAEIRELNIGGAQTGALAEGPRLVFHWGGRIATQLIQESNGRLAVYDQPGTGYQDFIAKAITSSGNTTVSGSLTVAGSCLLNGNSIYEADNYGAAYARGIRYDDGAVMQGGIGGYGPAGGFTNLYMALGASPWTTGSGIRVSTANMAIDHPTVNITGKFSPQSTSNRSAGMYGTYDSTKTGHVWSMGPAYAIPDDGSTFGNLYGLAYKHTNNATGGTMAGGHQIVVCSAGTAGVALGMAGGIWTSGNITAYSDIRVKTNIQVIPNALDKVCQLRGVTFERIDRNGERQAGLIAQEVQKVLPEVVVGTESEDDKLSIAYGNMAGLFVEAIKEVRAEVIQLRAVVEELRAEVEELRRAA